MKPLPSTMYLVSVRDKETDRTSDKLPDFSRDKEAEEVLSVGITMIPPDRKKDNPLKMFGISTEKTALPVDSTEDKARKNDNCSIKDNLFSKNSNSTKSTKNLSENFMIEVLNPPKIKINFCSNLNPHLNITVNNISINFSPKIHKLNIKGSYLVCPSTTISKRKMPQPLPTIWVNLVQLNCLPSKILIRKIEHPIKTNEAGRKKHNLKWIEEVTTVKCHQFGIKNREAK